MADQVDYVGQRLGNYRLIRQLGQGGFAEVYLGEHIHLKTQAAVEEVVMRALQKDPRQRFEDTRAFALARNRPVSTAIIRCRSIPRSINSSWNAGKLGPKRSLPKNPTRPCSPG